MLKIQNISSLSDFMRNFSDHAAELKRTGDPRVLTKNGKAVLVVQDSDAYQALLDRLEEASTLLALARALEEGERGEGEPLEVALPRLRERLGIGGTKE